MARASEKLSPRRRRKITSKQIEAFDTDLRNTDWSSLFSSCVTVDSMVSVFNLTVEKLKNTHFPKRRIRRKTTEPLWFTERCRDLWKVANRTYSKQGNSIKYKKDYKIFETELNKSKDRFFNIELDEASSSDPKNWHKSVQKLASNGCVKSSGPPVVQTLEGLTDAAKADVVADVIEAKTASYSPLDVQSVWNQYPESGNALLSVNDVKLAIDNLRVPCGLHQDDPPKPAIKSLALSWAIPLTRIFNEVLRSS